MKILSLIFALAIFGTLGFFAYQESRVSDVDLPEFALLEPDNSEAVATATPRITESEPLADVAVIAENLTIPWDIAFLPDGSMLVTERVGTVRHIESSGETKGVFPVSGVEHIGEGGLLGITLHPNFEENHYVYLFQTTEGSESLENRVVRYTFKDNDLAFDRVILDGLRGARYHDGGRMEFGPDGYLYVTLGDALRENESQNPQSLIGAILRITDEGAVPEDNPFGNEIYSYGHRNPQGLAWDEEGRLWSTEHGRSGLRSGLDEINLIEKGGNYGWPDSEGDTVKVGTIAPKLHSTADVTWAPASAEYHDGSLYFGGLRGQTLYEAVLGGDRVVELREHFVGEYKRIRAVRLGPDGYLYITTSNRDGGATPAATDDRIIRVNPDVL